MLAGVADISYPDEGWSCDVVVVARLMSAPSHRPDKRQVSLPSRPFPPVVPISSSSTLVVLPSWRWRRGNLEKLWGIETVIVEGRPSVDAGCSCFADPEFHVAVGRGFFLIEMRLELSSSLS